LRRKKKGCLKNFIPEIDGQSAVQKQKKKSEDRKTLF
jgi:hypothetical protein